MTLSNKKELLIHATWVNLKYVLKWKKSDAKDYKLYGNNYIKVLEKAKL